MRETKIVEQPEIKHETFKVNVDKNWLSYDDFLGYGASYDRRFMSDTSNKEKVIEKPKIEIKEENIIVRDISNHSRKYTEFGHSHWHNHSEFSLLTYQGTASIKISDNVGGCGVQQLYSWLGSANNENIEFL